SREVSGVGAGSRIGVSGVGAEEVGRGADSDELRPPRASSAAPMPTTANKMKKTTGLRFLSSPTTGMRRVEAGGVAIGTRPVPDRGVEVAIGTRSVPRFGVEVGAGAP